MEFPELLSVLLYEHCSAQVSSELPRLKSLAYANGTNPALILYLKYFTTANECLNPEQLLNYGSGVPKFLPEHIDGDLETAAEFEGKTSFAMALEEAWVKARKQYVQDGYLTARTIALGNISAQDIKEALIKLYGDDQSNWDCLKSWTIGFGLDPIAS
jgi:hypothetical protein